MSGSIFQRRTTTSSAARVQVLKRVSNSFRQAPERENGSLAARTWHEVFVAHNGQRHEHDKHAEDVQQHERAVQRYPRHPVLRFYSISHCSMFPRSRIACMHAESTVAFVALSCSCRAKAGLFSTRNPSSATSCPYTRCSVPTTQSTHRPRIPPLQTRARPYYRAFGIPKGEPAAPQGTLPLYCAPACFTHSFPNQPASLPYSDPGLALFTGHLELSRRPSFAIPPPNSPPHTHTTTTATHQRPSPAVLPSRYLRPPYPAASAAAWAGRGSCPLPAGACSRAGNAAT